MEPDLYDVRARRRLNEIDSDCITSTAKPLRLRLGKATRHAQKGDIPVHPSPCEYAVIRPFNCQFDCQPTLSRRRNSRAPGPAGGVSLPVNLSGAGARAA